MSRGEIDNPDILYRYLTFDTPLPTPISRHVSCFGSEAANIAEPAEPPTPPDLTIFTDPKQWPRSRKTVMLILCCVGAMSGVERFGQDI